MKIIEFGKWKVEINEEGKEIDIVKDENRMILLDGENYYLLYAQLKEEDIILQNVDNDVLITMNLDKNKVNISFKKEEI
ncbi:hypothetical protein QUV80_02115 [Paraclostridium benzoelyticum]|nr:hypothetical protein [Paraclostridium benzoelyticum]